MMIKNTLKLVSKVKRSSTLLKATSNFAVVYGKNNQLFQLNNRFYTTPQQQQNGQMFCFQCEQTQDNKGCTTVGVCGKTPEVAGLQDLLVFKLRRLSLYLDALLASGKVKPNEILDFHDFSISALYSTLTNVNFDEDRFTKEFLVEADERTKAARQWYFDVLGTEATNFDFVVNAPSVSNVGVKNGWHKNVLSEDNALLHELVQYGLKGIAAYGKEGFNYGKWTDNVVTYYHKALAFLADTKNSRFGNDANDTGKIIGLALECGETNLGVMKNLNDGHKEKFGVPEPTPVSSVPVPGKCIVVSGHDIGALQEILKQTEGTGINVYTHGELLPAHSYPEIKKYKHLKGNYGTAWQVQKIEFSQFPGAILMTTNCIIEPRQAYKDRIFTTGVVGFHGVKHCKTHDFSEVIKAAEAAEGWTEEKIQKHFKVAPAQKVVGFGHDFILSIAPTIINAVKKGYIKRFFVIGGCDGSEGERSYYKDLSNTTPNDSLMLTLGCAKYRINQQDHGTIKVPISKDGEREEKDLIDIPRLLDVGQCNDTYSAVQIAVALAGAFKTDVNSLPLSYAISWFEQKAVAVLLTLLHLGIRNIRLGPRLPAFIDPRTLNLLVEKFNISPNTPTPQEDLQNMLKGH